MCTSFVHRGEDIITAMNFDNNGMDYSISTKPPNQFAVLIDGGRGKAPSFGVNSDGVFINNIVLDPSGKGLYKRPNKKVTSTIRLVAGVLSGEISMAGFGEYLSSMEVVNIPDWSTHCMVCDSDGNAWCVEPGRGNIFGTADIPYFAVTNFSLWDVENGHGVCDCDRYKIVTDALAAAEEMSVSKAFQILEAAKQSEGEWITAFSMVYSRNANTVYYSLNGDFGTVFEYKFMLEGQEQV